MYKFWFFIKILWSTWIGQSTWYKLWRFIFIDDQTNSSFNYIRNRVWRLIPKMFKSKHYNWKFILKLYWNSKIFEARIFAGPNWPNYDTTIAESSSNFETFCIRKNHDKNKFKHYWKSILLIIFFYQYTVENCLNCVIFN